MRPWSVFVLVSAVGVVAAGCGASADSRGAAVAAVMERTATAAALSEAEPVARSAGTRITVRASEFGPMLWGPGRQAIYIFERDRRDLSRCYGECARLWPPVFAEGKPRAGAGTRASLLGTTRRKDGRRQVTYAGKPLYYYAHESADEVLCHNVELNGGLWWVVGANGKRRP